MSETIAAFELKAADGASIAAYRALPKGKPKAIVQIAHGMAEHFDRYAGLVKRLTEAGYAVYGNDHRGHGRSKDAHGLGNFGPRGFKALADDMAALTRVAKAEHKGVPLVLLGHSMGSFASQVYLPEHHRELAALVLSGTAALDKLLEHMAAAGAGGLQSFNAGFEHRTGFEWLSRDPAEVDKYVADPLCGFDIEPASFGSMAETAAPARFDPRLKEVRRDLPIYIISGEFDPVTGKDQIFARMLEGTYRSLGLKNVTHRVYPGGRHEMFNETNRTEVEDELIAWLGRALAGRSQAP